MTNTLAYCVRASITRQKSWITQVPGNGWVKVLSVVEVCNVQHVFLAVCPEGNVIKFFFIFGEEAKYARAFVPDTQLQSSKTVSHPLDQILDQA
jgi:hypothetical protein